MGESPAGAFIVLCDGALKGVEGVGGGGISERRIAVAGAVVGIGPEVFGAFAARLDVRLPVDFEKLGEIHLAGAVDMIRARGRSAGFHDAIAGFQGGIELSEARAHPVRQFGAEASMTIWQYSRKIFCRHEPSRRLPRQPVR